VILQPRFQLDKPYHLLNAGEVKEFVELHVLRPGPRPKPRELFEKSKDLFYLTNVFFNQSRTLALTAHPLLLRTIVRQSGLEGF